MSSSPPPSEQELLAAERAAIEEQLSRMSSADMALQAAVSLISLGGRRLGLVPGAEGERDLEQVRDAIDGARGLMPVLERRMHDELRWLRDALSQLQMAYAREARAGAGAGPESPPARGPGEQAPPREKPAAGAAGSAGPAGRDAPEGAPESGGQQAGGDQRAPGPAESSGRLWVPKP